MNNNEQVNEIVKQLTYDQLKSFVLYCCELMEEAEKQLVISFAKDNDIRNEYMTDSIIDTIVENKDEFNFSAGIKLFKTYCNQLSLSIDEIFNLSVHCFEFLNDPNWIEYFYDYDGWENNEFMEAVLGGFDICINNGKERQVEEFFSKQLLHPNLCEITAEKVYRFYLERFENQVDVKLKVIEYYHNHFGYDTFLEYYLDTLSKKGEDPYQLYIRAHYNKYRVRNYLICNALNAHQYETAISILNESVKYDKQSLTLVEKEYKQLIDLYDFLEKEDEALEKRKEFIEQCYQMNINTYKEVIERLSEKERESYMRKVLHYPTCQGIYLDILAYHNLYDELWSKICNKYDFFSYSKYLSILPISYNSEIVNWLFNCFLYRMDKAKKRNEYRRVIEDLPICNLYDSSLITSLTEAWKAAYKNN